MGKKLDRVCQRVLPSERGCALKIYNMGCLEVRAPAPSIPQSRVVEGVRRLAR